MSRSVPCLAYDGSTPSSATDTQSGGGPPRRTIETLSMPSISRLDRRRHLRKGWTSEAILSLGWRMRVLDGEIGGASLTPPLSQVSSLQGQASPPRVWTTEGPANRISVSVGTRTRRGFLNSVNKVEAEEIKSHAREMSLRGSG